MTVSGMLSYKVNLWRSGGWPRPLRSLLAPGAAENWKLGTSFLQSCPFHRLPRFQIELHHLPLYALGCVP